jgi:hypothetical protein
VILIAPQWRAADIVLEIHQHGIRYQKILLEYQGRLVDYFQDDHPYRPMEPPRFEPFRRQEEHPVVPAPNFFTASVLSPPLEAMPPAADPATEWE